MQRWSHLVPAGAVVLDVACGQGRHLRWFRALGHPVTGIDRDVQAVQSASEVGEAILADIEGAPWPLAGRQFGAVVVTNYLWRPLLPTLIASVAEGGVLLYETFAHGNASVGRPARPDFLLQPGELIARGGLRERLPPRPGALCAAHCRRARASARRHGRTTAPPIGAPALVRMPFYRLPLRT